MIEGKSVRFRAVEERDLEALAKWLNDPVLSSLVVGWSFPVSLAEQRRWYERSLADPGTCRLIVEHEGEAIGLTGLWEIDWRNRHALTALKLGPEAARGKGLGTDAILTLMSWAFYEVGLNRLWGAILPYNIGSYKVYVEKCGWKVEGVLRQEVFRHGAFHDLYRVAVLREEFEHHPRFAEYAPRQVGEPGPRLEVRPEDRVDL